MTTLPAGATKALPASRGRAEASVTDSVLAALASLRLTVVLMALMIFLIFVGTLAQVDHGIWYVVNDGYFRVWFAQVEWQCFVRLAEMFTKEEAAPIAGGFWFPGGKLIGSIMFANLLAAHAIRFKVAAKGARLTQGLVVLAAGVAASFWVLSEGLSLSLKGQLSPEFCRGLWHAVRAAIAGVAVVGVYWVATKRGKLRAPEWWLSAAVSGSLLAVAAYLFANPTVGPDDAGMRIVWTLTKCAGAAVLTWAGCWLVFKQRAGIVLLHAGVGLLMVGELVTDLTAVEGRMSITEGQTINYAYDIRTAELAVTTDEGDAERVTVIPDHLLISAADSGELIKHPDLPFDLRVVRYDRNAILLEKREPPQTETNPASEGAGLTIVAMPAPEVSGVKADAPVDLPAAYIEPVSRDGGESLGVWLTATGGTESGFAIRPQTISLGDATHTIDLRFKRLYKPYAVTLNDFQFNRYAGTNVPKDFSSYVTLRDDAEGVDLPQRIWMNNPLRYAGDTLYQSGFDDRTELTTILQVVSNRGWMIPYVSCLFVGLGMLTHFTLTLTRFMRRRVEEANRLEAKGETLATSGPGLLSASAWKQPTVWAPALAAVLVAGYFAGKARPALKDESVRRFAALPVADRGRVKPMDTLARTTLQSLSSRQEVLRVDENGDKLPPVPASEWLLDVLSGKEGWRDHRVFRIDNLEVLEAFGLEPRPGSFRYSYAEVMADPGESETKFRNAFAENRRIQDEIKASGDPEPMPLVQQRIYRLGGRVNALERLAMAFNDPPIRGGEGVDIVQQFRRAQGVGRMLDQLEVARAVPPVEPGGAWSTLFQANLDNLLREISKQPLNENAIAWSDALVAYRRGEDRVFADKLTDLEAAVEKHQRAVAASPEVLAEQARSERLDTTKTRFETFFNGFSPVYYCAAMYLLAFVLVGLGWLGRGGGAWSRSLGRAALAVLLMTLVVHTFALVGRVYISGRPPVTNLYSSAVFIGWGAVLMSVAFEAIYRLSVGSAVAAAVGFATQVVAYNLSLEGDTFTVLRAVLDTQFWLATHVVCISLGYSATFLAGFLGIGYLLAVCLPGLLGQPSRLDKRGADQIVRMTYGTLCFALLLSFVGTVLGGLWADDSWGRFWGWDPKENGALIIVFWNALVLHARWGKMVGPTGIALLAVGGNIVTTWSWFGVNELGVGLHAYGDSESSTALWLLGFVVSQLAVIALAGLAPKPKLAS